MLAQDKEPDKEIDRGFICSIHKMGYTRGAECPGCYHERTYKKDKHSYRQFKNKGR